MPCLQVEQMYRFLHSDVEEPSNGCASRTGGRIVAVGGRFSTLNGADGLCKVSTKLS